MLSLPVVATLAVGAGAVVAGAGVVALPVYGSYRLHKHIQRNKALRRQQRRRLETRRLKQGKPASVKNSVKFYGDAMSDVDYANGTSSG